MFRTKSLAIVSTLVVLFHGLPSYSAHHFPDYPVRPAGEYASKVVNAGLIVASEAVDDPEQQKTYFNSHLSSSKGILPVLIVIQDTSATDSYLFDASAIGLGEAAEVSGKGARKTASLLSSGGLINLALVDEVSDVRENMMKKEIHSKTLSPGSSIHGFVYVPVPRDAPRQKIHLQVPITNTRSSEIEVVNLIL